MVEWTLLIVHTCGQRKGLTLDEKKIVLANDALPKMSQREAVTKIGVPESFLEEDAE